MLKHYVPNVNGKVFSLFEVIKLIGKGSFGNVFQARRKADNLLCVLKVVSLLSLSREEKEVALNECQLVSQLDHPNIVKYFDSFIESDNLIIVLEHCSGGDLQQKLEHTSNYIAEEEIWKYVAQLCDALKYLHEKRILHRDIKPQNIFLDTEGNVKIGDFGLGRLLSSQSLYALTSVGTPLYVSPEMVEEKPYNDKSDVWALGCLVYQLASKSPPFLARNQVTLAKKIVSDKPEPLPKHYSSEFQFLVLKMLEKSPSKRPDIFQIVNYSALKFRIERENLRKKEHQIRSDVTRFAVFFEKEIMTNYAHLALQLEKQQAVLDKLKYSQMKLQKTNIELEQELRDKEDIITSLKTHLVDLQLKLSTITTVPLPAEPELPTVLHEQPLEHSPNDSLIDLPSAAMEKTERQFVSPDKKHTGVISFPVSPTKTPSKVTHTSVTDVSPPRITEKRSTTTPSVMVEGHLLGGLSGAFVTMFIWCRTNSFGETKFEDKRNSKVYCKGVVWDSKEQYTLSCPTRRIVVLFKVNSTLHYVPMVKSFRVRLKGEDGFNKLKVIIEDSPNDENAVNNEKKGWHLLQLTDVPTKEIAQFMLEFDTPNPVDEVLVLRSDKQNSQLWNKKAGSQSPTRANLGPPQRIPLGTSHEVVVHDEFQT